MTNKQWSPDVYLKAWHYATRYHHGQTYGGAEPQEQIDYINHIGSVAMEVLHALAQTPDVDGDLAVQCALLHDVIEDTPVTYDMLKNEFGAQVADGVLALTKDVSLPDKENQMRDSLERIRRQPREVWMVKLADRITNLYYPPFYWTPAKIESYRQEAIIIYEALHGAHAGLAARLSEKIKRYRQFVGEDEN
ncbi:MAG: HD domain-containing protein [Anaerolineae bacterium]|nr:HD domain-containing protein [Anaerolineae bacterium]